jgi:hypothetical protein
MKGWVYHLQLLLALASAVILRSESRGNHGHILLSPTRYSPNLEGQVPAFISHRNRVARLYPQALGSLFVASFFSQGYGGGIPHATTQDNPESITCPPFITSGRTAYRSPPPTVPLLSRAYLLLRKRA